MRANPLQARGRYSHRCFPMSIPFSYLFFSPSLVSQARIMPICQTFFVSTSRANVTEQPEQPCKATPETLASNPGNIGRQHYQQPCYCDSIPRHYRRCVFIGTYYSQQLGPESQRTQSRFPPDPITPLSNPTPIRSDHTIYNATRSPGWVTLYIPASRHGTRHEHGQGQGISYLIGGRRR